VSGFIQVLNKKLNRSAGLEVEDLEFIKERIRIIERQVANCIEISRRYLSFLRQQGDEAAKIGVQQLLADLEQLVRVHPSIHENDFHVAPLHESVSVRINGTDLIQILLNLSVNAFQCSPQPHRVQVDTEVLRAPVDLTDFKDGSDDRFLNVES